jgi:hypothetical protein
MIHNHRESSDIEVEEIEPMVRVTGPSDEWICDLAEEMLLSWRLHIRDQRKIQATLITCTGSALSANSVSGERQSCSQNKAAATKHTQKRHRSSDREDDCEDRPRKRPNNVPGSTPHDGVAVVHLLACPFYKKDPTRYSILNTMERRYRGCSNRYLQDIGRLKYESHAYVRVLTDIVSLIDSIYTGTMSGRLTTAADVMKRSLHGHYSISIPTSPCAVRLRIQGTMSV